MEYEKAIKKALSVAKSGDLDAFKDCYEMIVALERDGSAKIISADGDAIVGNGGVLFDKKNFKLAHGFIKDLRKECNRVVSNGKGSNGVVDLYWKCHLFDAPYSFDSFCLYLEKNREEKKKFYLPRRKQLLTLVNAMQDLSDRKISLLCLSEPPGVGKTTLAEFFLAYESGRHPDMPNLTGSHNNAFLNGVYGEMLRILDPSGEYCWHDVFPSLRVVSTNAKDMLIDIAERKKNGKRFSTLEFTSVGSGNAGKVRAMNLLYCDDLVDGIETAMSKERLDKLYQMYTTDLRQRKQGDFCAELHIATRWSVNDPIGRLQQQFDGDKSARFIALPALDENDESLWDYPYGLGYSTKMLHEQRDIMDDVSWKAIFCNAPIEREGQLYSADEFRRYFELPNREPDSIIAVCDCADGGGDSWSLPIAYQYGSDFYIDKWVFDNGKPDIVEERIAKTLIERKVKTAQFESNRGGGRIADSIQKRVKDGGGTTHITKKWSESQKHTRIIVSSGSVKSMLLFKDESLYQQDKEYAKAMRELCSYSMVGGKANKHDDAADSLSMLIDFIENMMLSSATVIKRPF